MSRLLYFFIASLLLFTAIDGYSNSPNEIVVMEKLRNTDWEVWVHAGYDLALMDDSEAINLLLEALKDPNVNARWHAMEFLDRYDDPRILPALKERFLADTEHIRNNSARTIAGIDAKYASNLFISQLQKAGDPIGKNISMQLLCEMKDARVIPFLAQRLDNPATRKDSALALAGFGDKRAVPALMEMLTESANDEHYSTENIIRSLIRIGDKSYIPSLVNDKKYLYIFMDILAHPREFDPPISSEFGRAVAESLLKVAEENPTQEFQSKVIGVLRRIKDPSLAPIYGKIFLESKEYSPFQSIAYVLADMGTEGVQYLLDGTKLGKTYRIAFNALGSYNNGRVVYEISTLALNKQYPFRKSAIDTLSEFGNVWRKSVMSTVVSLMRDPNLLIKLHALRVVRVLEMHELSNIIRGLANDEDPQVKIAALSILDVFANKPPVQLQIEMDKKSYGYDKPIIMEYNIINVADYDISISSHGVNIPDAIYGTAIGLPKILNSDGISLEYKGSAVSMGPPGRNDYRVLHPGDSMSGQIEITKFYEVYQPSVYTAKLVYHPIGDGVEFGIWGWWGQLTSNEVNFNVKHPSRWHFMTILRNTRISNANDENTFNEALKACKKMGELHRHTAVNELKKTAFYESSDEPDTIRVRQEELSKAALSALAKVQSKKLIPDWLKLLKDNDVIKREIALDALIRLKHPMAIETLKLQIFDRSSFPGEPALKLKELGDNSGIEWITKIMPKKIKHWDPEERRKAIIALRRIHATKGLREALASKEPMVREEGYWWLKEVAQDIGIGGLMAMSKNQDPNVKKAVAYQLARFGNSSGLSLIIRQDLDAVDSETRQQARYAIIELYKSKGEKDANTES